MFVLGNHIPRELIDENKNEDLGGNPRTQGSDGIAGATKHSKNKWGSFLQQDEHFALKNAQNSQTTAES